MAIKLKPQAAANSATEPHTNGKSDRSPERPVGSAQLTDDDILTGACRQLTSSMNQIAAAANKAVVALTGKPVDMVKMACHVGSHQARIAQQLINCAKVRNQLRQAQSPSA